MSGSPPRPDVVEAFVKLYATNVLRDLDIEMDRKRDDEQAAARRAPAAPGGLTRLHLLPRSDRLILTP